MDTRLHVPGSCKATRASGPKEDEGDSGADEDPEHPKANHETTTTLTTPTAFI